MPQGLVPFGIVEGGGDSLFDSLLRCVKFIPLLSNGDKQLQYPEDHIQLRELLVDKVLQNLEHYGIPNTKDNRKSIKVMRYQGHLPREELILAACELFHVEVHVHHGMQWPVVYRMGTEVAAADRIVHLQCISGIHFNPVIRESTISNTEHLPSRYVNTCKVVTPVSPTTTTDIPIESDHENNDSNFDIICPHEQLPGTVMLEIDNFKICSLVDTGSQICLITCSMVGQLIAGGVKFTSLNKGEETDCVSAFDGTSSQLVGALRFKSKLLGVDMGNVPFALVQDDVIPCCCLLGQNFLDANGIKVDYDLEAVTFNRNSSEYLCPMVSSDISDFSLCAGLEDVMAVVTRQQAQVEESEQSNSNEEENGQGNLNEEENEQSNLSEEEDVSDEDTGPKVRFSLENENLEEIQDHNFAIRTLKNKIRRQIRVRDWNNRCLQQFKRHSRSLSMIDNVLVKHIKDFHVPVVPFPLMVDIIVKVHIKFSHVGIRKIVALVEQHFWHPALGNVARDVCVACNHCQLFKIGQSHLIPPVLKIEAQFPFELVALDLVQLPRTAQGHTGLLVAIDHCSKSLMVVPIKDKLAKTISSAFVNRILPTMTRVPNRVLTDNGPEFKAVEFNDALQEYNITYTYSTSYKACSNGCVERANRTIIGLLKGHEQFDTHWDKHITQVLITYNNTHHSSIDSSPSQFILKKQHLTRDPLPVDAEAMNTWKEGHINFKSFTVGQKVAYKIQVIGNQAKDKLKQKYIGPCEVTKIQSNKVTYEILMPDRTVRKVHHRQLKEWFELPAYLRTYTGLLKDDETVDENDDNNDHVPGLAAFPDNSDSESNSDSNDTSSDSNDSCDSNDSNDSSDSNESNDSNDSSNSDDYSSSNDSSDTSDCNDTNDPNSNSHDDSDSSSGKVHNNVCLIDSPIIFAERVDNDEPVSFHRLPIEPFQMYDRELLKEQTRARIKKFQSILDGFASLNSLSKSSVSEINTSVISNDSCNSVLSSYYLDRLYLEESSLVEECERSLGNLVEWDFDDIPVEEENKLLPAESSHKSNDSAKFSVPLDITPILHNLIESCYNESVEILAWVDGAFAMQQLHLNEIKEEINSFNDANILNDKCDVLPESQCEALNERIGATNRSVALAETHVNAVRTIATGFDDNNSFTASRLLRSMIEDNPEGLPFISVDRSGISVKELSINRRRTMNRRCAICY